MSPDLLHVIAVSFNPRRYKSHYLNYTPFEQHMLDSGVKLYVVELTYGDIPYALRTNSAVTHIPVRGSSALFSKENLINIGISRLPPEAKYIAWIDADIEFQNPNWAEETVYKLQHNAFVQPWADCLDLDENGGILQKHRSFCYQRQHAPETCTKLGKSGYEFAHPGYAWATKRQTLDMLGGLIETAILGAADHHQALCMIGRGEVSIPGNMTENYKLPIMNWNARCQSHVKGFIDYVPGFIKHAFHGRKEDRKYVDRWEILKKHQFDPYTDLKYNSYGAVEFAGNKPEFQYDVMAYFAARNEDKTVW